jgi:N-acetylmuramoyl-L-alanine amidase
MAYVGTAQDSGNDLYTIASILEGEAGNQGAKGMQAVANVIANRAAQNYDDHGDSPVAQATAKEQFQGQSKPSPTALTVASKMLAGQLPDITSGATMYANPGASTASWARRLNETNSLKIGDHYFTDNDEGRPFPRAAAQTLAQPLKNTSKSKQQS